MPYNLEDDEELIQQEPNVRDYIAQRLAQNEAALKDAQATTSRDKGMAGIADGFGQAVAGMAGAPDSYKPDSYKSLHEDAEMPVKSFLEREKSKGATLTGANAEQEMVRKSDSYDPDSARSKMVQAIVTKYNPALKDTPFAAADASLVRGLEASRESADARKAYHQDIASRKNDDKKDLTISGLRKEATSGQLGKLYESYQIADRGANSVEQFAKNPTGYTDYGTLMTSLKTLQGDASVVREAEMKLGSNAASIFVKAQNAIEAASTGKSLQPEQRQSILQAMRTLTGIAKSQYIKASRPIHEQAKRKKLPLNEVFTDPSAYEAPATKKEGPHGPTVKQNGHTYNWNPQSGRYE